MADIPQVHSGVEFIEEVVLVVDDLLLPDRYEERIPSRPKPFVFAPPDVGVVAADGPPLPDSKSIEFVFDPPAIAAAEEDEDAIIDDALFNPRAAKAPKAASACSEVATGALDTLLLL